MAVAIQFKGVSIMKGICLTLLAAAAAASGTQAQALGRLAEVSIIDRETGATLAPHYYRGEYWVAGRPGARYALAIRNQTGGRLLAVTAVDGVNVVTGETAGWGQTGYVFGAWQGYEISGWRKSDTQVAAFEFTAAPGSYAARTGRPANVGVIGVALFRERPPEPVVPQYGALERASADAAAAAAPPEPPAAAAKSTAPATRLGTGHGQREDSYVEHTDFERANSRPDELIRIRYDSYANLLAMGVIRRPCLPPVTPEPFPDSPLAGYVPDPPPLRGQ
jgi:hypothetical protein